MTETELKEIEARANAARRSSSNPAASPRKTWADASLRDVGIGVKEERSNDVFIAHAPRRFVVWARVEYVEHELEMPADATDEQCEEACREALDTLIGNGDTGWNEVLEDGSEV